MTQSDFCRGSYFYGHRSILLNQSVHLGQVAMNACLEYAERQSAWWMRAPVHRLCGHCQCCPCLAVVIWIKEASERGSGDRYLVLKLTFEPILSSGLPCPSSVNAKCMSAYSSSALCIHPSFFPSIHASSYESHFHHHCSPPRRSPCHSCQPQ